MLVIKQQLQHSSPDLSSPEVDSVLVVNSPGFLQPREQMNLQPGVISVLTSRQLCERQTTVECWSSVLYSLALGEQKSESYKGKVCQSDQFPRQSERPVQSSPPPVLSLLSHHVEPGGAWTATTTTTTTTTSSSSQLTREIQLQTYRATEQF